MKYGNSLITFIYILLADLFLYFAASIYPGTFLVPYADILFALVFSLSLFGFFLSSFREQSRISWTYYYLLWLISLVFIFLYIFQPELLLNIAKYYFVLSVLIALLLAILDYKKHTARSIRSERARYLLEKQKYQGILNYQKKNLEELREYSSTLKELNEEYKIKNEQKNTEIGEAQRELSIFRREAELISSQIKRGQLSIEDLEHKTTQLRDRNAKIEEAKLKLAHLERQNLLLRKELGRKMGEAQRQSFLKEKYSKTLKNIRKDKKELESLLVVSPDGNSVHRPNCIVVRNVAKEDRKLIPSWKEAKAQNYKGCKLCNPQKNNESVVKGTVKYRFVGGKGLDKIHRLSCTSVARIAPKERQYFRSYKQAVKKGYTPCRVCNPTQ
jgi:hypothetical protein